MNFTQLKGKEIHKASTDHLDQCKDEQIHLIGTIQQFGFLLGFEKQNGRLLFYSSGAAKLIQEFLNSSDHIDWNKLVSLDRTLFSKENWDSISNKEDLAHRTYTFDNRSYSVEVSHTAKHIILSFEENANDSSEQNFVGPTESFIKRSNQSGSFKEFSSLFAGLIRTITGYDRVMVYKFDEDYNGEVFAEAKKDDLNSFYGLHYPHTDIPSQARELYKHKELRLINDVDAPDQHILSLNDDLEAHDIDLSSCTLRSSSPIHLKYLKNMGVAATLTISILIDKQLWGLVACHHYSPKYIDPNKRREALLQTQLLSTQIRRWEASEEYEKVQEKEHIYQSILEEVYKGSNKFEAATSTSYFLGLTESDGGAVIRGKEIYGFGSLPNPETTLKIHSWMQERNEKVFLSNEFSKHTEIGEGIKDIASGVLYYSFDTNSESAMIWFRKQKSEGTKWGGKPEKSADQPLTPRSSFEAWEETVNGISEKWYSHQIQAGLRLGAFLEKEVFISSLKEQKQKLERLADQLQSKNEELSQFNWISSHDMKEPLRKIRMFIDQIRLEEEVLTDTQKNYFSRLERSAVRMQKLIADLLDYARLSKEEAVSKCDLNEIIKELIEHHKTDDLNISISSDQLPTIEMVRFQIKQLFANLISNSIKFRKSGEDVSIEIVTQKVDQREMEAYHLNPQLEYFKIIYKDHGIGFDKEYNERIFEVFQRLHGEKKYEGTGIGLAICKKIVESHQGEIFADGVINEGVTFTIILPRIQQVN
tara:strand:+ start:25518 stop:27797 length:2280 start_codon:yes stop_codon:yes gene_type:complete